jgi:hypothetical protein
MKKRLFSINAAADLLERDRQTLVRALRHVQPDGVERGAPRYTMRTITDALDRNSGSYGGQDRLRSRLGEIADALEEAHRELDTKRAIIARQPTLEAKQPHSRAAMQVFERLKNLYEEADEINLKLDPTDLSRHVSRALVGGEFRELLAAIWGRDVVIDGVPLFAPGHDGEAVQ